MLETIKIHLSNQDNQLIAKGIPIIPLEYISLIDTLMYYYSISPNPNTSRVVSIICEKLLLIVKNLRLIKLENSLPHALKNWLAKNALLTMMKQ